MGYSWLTAERIPTPEWQDPFLGHSSLEIIANAGQWPAPVKYRVRLNGGDIYFEQDRLTYHFYQIPATPGHAGRKDAKPFGFRQPKVFSHAFQTRFVGANPQPELIPDQRKTTYHNYFLGNDPSHWAGGVPLYGVLTYEALYPGIDLRVYGSGEALKYDFLVAPGARAQDIALRFDGADKVFLKEGHLIIRTSVREVKEMPPVAYQIVAGRKQPVACEFVLKGDLLTYGFPDGYDPSYPLVIDPLVFSTYTGSVSDNWGFTATYDEDGNAYAGGIQRDATVGTGYPVTIGAFQNIFMGGTSDVTISKFSPDGSTLIYSTYLGGPPGTNTFVSYEDQPHSMVVSPEGELVVLGRTNSPNFPTTANAYDPTPNGDYDIFVTRFSADGTALIGSTLLGGTGDDGVNGSASFGNYSATKFNYGDDARGEVILDGAGNILLAACTNSNNFPTTGGVFQPLYGGGQDGVVVKLRPDLSGLLWSSFLGGSGQDAANTIKVDGSGNLFVAGGTASTNFPGPGGGAVPTYQGGSTDGFVVRLNPNGTSILSKTYAGTSAYDQIYLLDIDRNDEIYVVGQTEGPYPLVNPPAGPAYSNPNARQFITRYTNDLGSIDLSTVFGSANAARPNISPTALLVDRCDNIYVTGWGGSTNQYGNTNGMPLTSDAFQSSTDGSDFYMIVLSRDAQTLIYGSYFGGVNSSGQAGDHVDGGTSRFDKNGIVYHAVCAGCWGVSTFPTTPGVWSQTNNATGPGNADPGCNLAIFKLSFDLAGVEADFTPLDENNQPITNVEGCAPFEAHFDNQSYEGANPTNVTYFWDFDDNGATSTAFEPIHLFENPGTYEVMLIITDPTSCNISDTAYRTVEVLPPPEVNAGPDRIACPGDTIDLVSLTPATTYLWTPANLIIGPNDVQAPQTAITQDTRFILTITDANGCEARDTVWVNVDTSFRVSVPSDTLVCRGGSAPLTGTLSEPGTFFWTSLPAANINDPGSISTFVSNLDTTTMFYLVAESNNGCEAIDSVRIEVFEVFTLEDTFVCDGSSIVLASSNAVSYAWTPDDGSLNALNVASPVASPLVSTTYTVTATSAQGCISTKDILVEVRPLPVPVVSDDQAICIGESLRLSASGGLSYQWLPEGSLDDPNLADPLATPTETTTYVVMVSDADGCTAEDSTLVVVNPLPDVLATGTNIICEGDSLPLRASGALIYEWTPATNLSDPSAANPLAFPATTTLYTVTGTDANGCQAEDTVLVGVTARPQTVVDGINRLCVGGSIELTASGGESYLWNTGDTTALIEVAPDQPTTYIATAFVGQCAGFPDSLTVDAFFDYPEAAFSFTPEIGWAPEEVTFFNESTGADSYLWTFGFGPNSTEEHPVHGYPAAGTYSIRLIAFSDGGCPDTAFGEIFIDNVHLYVPSGFSPNGDGINDAFSVGYIGIQTLNVKIFSRWGPLIYESDNPDFQWNGIYKEKEVPEGVYIYVITGLGENGRRYQRTGTVTVFR